MLDNIEIRNKAVGNLSQQGHIQYLKTETNTTHSSRVLINRDLQLCIDHRTFFIFSDITLLLFFFLVDLEDII